MSCSGVARITGVRTWYVPKDRNPEECTYCTYCYDNGCVHVDVWPWQSSEHSRVSCDCTKDHSLICQKCLIERCFVAATGSECTNCNATVQTCSLRYCQNCSHSLSLCAFCGLHVTNTPDSASEEDKDSSDSASEEDANPPDSASEEDKDSSDSEVDIEDLIQCQII